MDELVFSVYGELELGDIGRSLWEPALPHLTRCVDDEAPFLAALADVARSSGLSQSMPVASLLDAYCDGANGLYEGLRRDRTSEAGTARRLIVRLQSLALTHVAAGYAAGLEETIAHLRRAADDASPLDLPTGAMKPAQIARQLSLEADRCRRTELSLGLVELAPEDECSRDDVAPRTREKAWAPSPDVGRCLRKNLRGYDSIGLTSDGGFLMLLPDISRRGLAGVGERLRRELSEYESSSAPRYVFALAHYDYVDASPGEMMEALDHSVHQARLGHEQLAWT